MRRTCSIILGVRSIDDLFYGQVMRSKLVLQMYGTLLSFLRYHILSRPMCPSDPLDCLPFSSQLSRALRHSHFIPVLPLYCSSTVPLSRAGSLRVWYNRRLPATAQGLLISSHSFIISFVHTPLKGGVRTNNRVDSQPDSASSTGPEKSSRRLLAPLRSLMGHRLEFVAEMHQVSSRC